MVVKIFISPPCASMVLNTSLCPSVGGLNLPKQKVTCLSVSASNSSLIFIVTTLYVFFLFTGNLSRHVDQCFLGKLFSRFFNTIFATIHFFAGLYWFDVNFICVRVTFIICVFLYCRKHNIR